MRPLYQWGRPTPADGFSVGDGPHRAVEPPAILDAHAAWNCVNDFTGPSCVIVKHTNPCGVATRGDLLEAYRLAVRADATSAYGGIVAFNRVVDEALARELREFRSPNDDEKRELIDFLAENPLAGDEIPGTGGVRKVRFAASGRGKRGGARIIYYYLDDTVPTPLDPP